MPKCDEARGQVRGRYECFDPGDSDLEAVAFEFDFLPGESDIGSDLLRREPQFQSGAIVQGQYSRRSLAASYRVHTDAAVAVQARDNATYCREQAVTMVEWKRRPDQNERQINNGHHHSSPRRFCTYAQFTDIPIA
jgi:hypothetical protein